MQPPRQCFLAGRLIEGSRRHASVCDGAARSGPCPHGAEAGGRAAGADREARPDGPAARAPARAAAVLAQGSQDEPQQTHEYRPGQVSVGGVVKIVWLIFFHIIIPIHNYTPNTNLVGRLLTSHLIVKFYLYTNVLRRYLIKYEKSTSLMF